MFICHTDAYHSDERRNLPNHILLLSIFDKMTTDYLIIGQGICGTFLSWNLIKAGKKVIVIDQPQPFSSSKVASGIINPVTGRRVVSTWMIDELMSFAWNAYNEIGNKIGEKVIEQKNIIVFPPSQQMVDAHAKRIHEENSFVNQISSDQFQDSFSFLFKTFEITPVYLVYLYPLLHGWRKKLIEQQFLLEEEFQMEQLHISAQNIQYKNIIAEKIFFCDGVNTFKNYFWKNLPYIYNKGQALIADIPALPQDKIYKYGNITFTPWYDDLCWVGSSYENEFETELPTDEFKQSVTLSLKNVLKIPFTVIDHFASLRPAALERRPFVGLHPHCPAMGILNGMGTKGCSLAPYFADELAQHVINNNPLTPLVDVKRFSGMLAR